MIGLRVETRRHEGPRLLINCPSCRRWDVEADSYTEVSDNFALWTVLLFTSELRIVRCRDCNGVLESSRELSELTELGPEELDSHLTPYTSFVWKAMAWVAIFTCWMPLFGQIFSLVVYIANRRSPGRSRRLSVWALGISLGYLVAVIVAGLIVLIVHLVTGQPLD